MEMDCTLRVPRADAIRDSSNFGLLGYFKCIVHFHTQVSDGTFKLGMPKKQLRRSQVLGSPVDQRRFRTPH